jgi:hypothetical protein
MQKTNHQNQAISGDISIEGMRTAVMLLETELSVLENRRADLYKRLNAFRVRYNATLGMLLGEILRLRLEQFRRLHDANPDNERQVREAEEDLQQHDRSMHEVRDEVILKLPKGKDKELQQKFHKASKLCHPDLVEESQRQRATELFMDLNNAYYYNNLARVTAILEMLELHGFGISGTGAGLSTRALLEMHESRLKTDIARLRAEMDDIRRSSPYLALCEIDDLDQWFGNMAEKLTRERDAIKASMSGLNPEEVA